MWFRGHIRNGNDSPESDDRHHGTADHHHDHRGAGHDDNYRSRAPSSDLG